MRKKYFSKKIYSLSYLTISSFGVKNLLFNGLSWRFFFTTIIMFKVMFNFQNICHNLVRWGKGLVRLPVFRLQIYSGSPPRGLQNASNSDFSYFLSYRFRSNGTVCSWSSECSKWCRLLYWPPLRKMGGGCLFCQNLHFWAQPRAVFSIWFRVFSYHNNHNNLRKTVMCFAAFLGDPLFCTNLQNRWIYFSGWMDSCIWFDVVAEFEELFPIRLNFMKIRPAVCTW
jgi:hypothetical protein